MDNFSGIQVIGTQRSGTNLLRLILNQFNEISAPHPPHILKTFVPIIDNYGDLSLNGNFRSLITDVVEWIEANPVSWNLTLNIEDVLLRCRNRTIFELFKVIYELKAESDDAKIWCCKSTFNVHYFKLLEENKLKPFYIHLYRDGRDVALSFKKAPVGHKHIYQIAKQWKSDQVAAIDIKKIVGKERYIDISYEQLIRSPQTVLNKLCNTIGLTYNSLALNYYNSKESKTTARAGGMWENVKKPIISTNSGMYTFQMNSADIEMFESVAGSMLNYFGYKTQICKSESNFEFSANEIAEFELLNFQMIKAVKNSLKPKEIKIARERKLLKERFSLKPLG